MNEHMEVHVEKLRTLRIDHGYSKKALSRAAGLTDSHVYQIERRGRANPDTLKKIADVLGVRASELLSK